MNKSDFVHLHVHTVHSLLDGFTRIPDLVDTIKSFGQQAVAITDHGSMAGVPSLWREAKRVGIKPIAGIEAYICEDINVKQKIEGKKTPYYHITLLAKDESGYRNLCELSRRAYTVGFYSKPRIDLQTLDTFREGLICMSGCVGGWAQQLIIREQVNEAIDVIIQLSSIFGEDFYLEVQNTGEKDQEIVNRTFIDLSRRMGISIVATGDSHYTKKGDSDLHDTLLCIGIKKQKSESNRLNFKPGRYGIHSTEEMLKLGFDKNLLLSTRRVSEKCTTYSLPRAGGLPHIDGDIESLAFEGLRRKLPDAPEAYWTRLCDELGVIGACGFQNYFLLISKIIGQADDRGMFHGWGRGSSAGSLVAFSLGITNIDPMKYGLYFERFLNADRKEPPDIDLDFTDEDRPEIIKYIEDTFGKDNVSQVGTYSTLGPRQLIIDSCRVLGKDVSSVERIVKSVIPYDPTLKVADVLVNANVMRIIGKYLGSDVVKCLHGFQEVPRHGSAHAAGVLIDSRPLVEALPLMSTAHKGVDGNRDHLVTQYVYDDLKELGYEKIDILGVKTLRILQKMARRLGIDLNKIPLDDDKAYDLLSRGKTVGVFQFEYHGSQMFLRDFRPQDFNDVMMANALYRPGPMQAGKGLPELFERRSGRKKPTYLHKDMVPILKDTYGIMLYQEQIMKVAQVMCGWSLNQADHLRYAIGKKKKEKVEELKDQFIIDCKAGPDIGKKLFDQIEYFARYGWNKAHAAAYGMVTYVSAYLKANHPVEYIAECLNSDLKDHEKVIELLKDATSLNIRTAKPHVNKSLLGFTVHSDDKGKYLMRGLGAIKGVGTKAAEMLVLDREFNDYYHSVEDVRNRIPRNILNSSQFEMLRDAGAFEDMAECYDLIDVPF